MKIYVFQEIYSTSLQLFEKGRQLRESEECDKELIESESKVLEATVHTFAGSLDEKRDILVQATVFFQNMELVHN